MSYPHVISFAAGSWQDPHPDGKTMGKLATKLGLNKKQVCIYDLPVLVDSRSPLLRKRKLL